MELIDLRGSSYRLEIALREFWYRAAGAERPELLALNPNLKDYRHGDFREVRITAGMREILIEEGFGFEGFEMRAFELYTLKSMPNVVHAIGHYIPIGFHEKWKFLNKDLFFSNHFAIPCTHMAYKTLSEEASDIILRSERFWMEWMEFYQ